MEETEEDGYLILTRRPNETLRIGEDILLHVVSVGRNVRICVEAPREKRILRSELLDRPPTQEAEVAEAPQAAEPREQYRADAAPASRPQPVVRYRRRRRLSVGGDDGATGFHDRD